MVLDIFIKDLLYRYECVIIPELGAFLTNTLSCSFDNTSNTFFSPKKTVSFNPYIKQNDGLLANYISHVKHISFEDAKNDILQQVIQLKTALKQGETILFKDVGSLALNAEGVILFTPQTRVNYLKDAFGLENLTHISPVNISEKNSISRSKLDYRPYFKYAAIAVIGLALLGTTGALGSKYYLNTIEKHNQLAQEEANKIIDDRIQQATFSLNTFPAITLDLKKENSIPEPKKYHIIAGCFRIKANSTKRIKQLQKEGFKAQNLGINKYGLHQISYDSFSDRDEALTALQDIRKTQSSDAWLLVKEISEI